MDINQKKGIVYCSKCILDSTDDPQLILDANGVCNHCYYYEKEKQLLVLEGEAARQKLDQTIQLIKEHGRNKSYDCLIGLSGGVDSSFVAYLAKQYGLRPLCVHFDNGWNSELAVQNIESIVNKLGFDLYTYVIDWEEFKDLQLAYLKASVIDIEVLTDHAIYGSMFKIAKDNDIKYVLGGHNVATEGILPYHWTYNKMDYINIQAIHKKYGTRKLKSFPFLDKKMKRFIKKSGVEFVNYLNWVPYVKDEVKKTLINELGWRDYGGKHYESVWTRFYQGYILPLKFGVDKRKAHLSTLICSGQMTREQALKEVKLLPFDAEQLKIDIEFVLKKLSLTKEEFDSIMNLPIQNHREFDTEGSFFNYYPVLRPLRPLWHSFKALLRINYVYKS
ncbi:N-acetyl sugar amidotransferase [Pseudoflavitalea sp. X16]|uniref:N-acetyl sugar amidotransferase n=1 Tax=Paraflavitalea devenefica TaxID=2716334 RepID=UPI00141F2437|nr:N-acetyl sugar amidotransferase [Paraflavitalea devenefica]NII24097.1 N-acetyl sugar amidotransferase [Paraflavitalea devenefica]